MTSQSPTPSSSSSSGIKPSFNYVSTIVEPSSVTHSCVGNLTGGEDRHLVIAYVLFALSFLCFIFFHPLSLTDLWFIFTLLFVYLFFAQKMHTLGDSLGLFSSQRYPIEGIHTTGVLLFLIGLLCINIL